MYTSVVEHMPLHDNAEWQSVSAPVLSEACRCCSNGTQPCCAPVLCTVNLRPCVMSEQLSRALRVLHACLQYVLNAACRLVGHATSRMCFFKRRIINSAPQDVAVAVAFDCQRLNRACAPGHGSLSVGFGSNILSSCLHLSCAYCMHSCLVFDMPSCRVCRCVALFIMCCCHAEALIKTSECSLARGCAVFGQLQSCQWVTCPAWQGFVATSYSSKIVLCSLHVVFGCAVLR